MKLDKIIDYYSDMYWLEENINGELEHDYDALCKIKIDQQKGLIPSDDYIKLSKPEDNKNILYGFYIANIHYDIIYNIEDDRIRDRIIYLLDNIDDNITNDLNSWFYIEFFYDYFEFFAGTSETFMEYGSTDTPTTIIEKYIEVMKKGIYWIEDAIIINKLKQIINHNISISLPEEYSNGKLTLVAGFISTGKTSAVINSIFKKEDFSMIVRYNNIKYISFYDMRENQIVNSIINLGNEHYDLLIIDDLWHYNNNNKALILLKKIAMNKNIPIIIIYNSNRSTEFEINLDKLNISNLNTNLVDEAYGFLYGGFISKLK